MASIDALRGSVMILMALDHVRDFFHIGAMSFSPTDLTRTTRYSSSRAGSPIFVCRSFMFAAGMGAFRWWQRGNHTKGQLSRFLWTRGVWFILVELTVMQFAYNFNISSKYLVFLLILWIFGAGMIGMAALIHLPMRWLLVLSVAVICLHNCLDRFDASQFGKGAWVWDLLHEPGLTRIGTISVREVYTLLPWIAVMAAGFCFGQVFRLEFAARQRSMQRIGLAAVVLFFVLRAVNLYGDPAPWSVQKSVALTVASFLNCTKYPASLDFPLMTLGPAILVLACFDRYPLKAANPLIVFGRVPFFYFVVHFYAIHTMAVLMACLRYGGRAFAFMFNPLRRWVDPQSSSPRTSATACGRFTRSGP